MIVVILKILKFQTFFNEVMSFIQLFDSKTSYAWFDSNKKNNCTLHINTNLQLDTKKLKFEFETLSFCEKIHKLIKINTKKYC